jgi:ketosteroid isomerase-like protein
MSRENVEVVHRVYERLNRGDVEGVVELCGDDIEMDFSERVFNPATYSGHDGIRRFYAGVKEVWQSYQWAVEDTRVADDWVVALLYCRGQGRQEAPPAEWRVAWLWKFREGRPVYLRFYRQRVHALEAVGLRK